MTRLYLTRHGENILAHNQYVRDIMMEGSLTSEDIGQAERDGVLRWQLVKYNDALYLHYNITGSLTRSVSLSEQAVPETTDGEVHQ